MKGRTLVAPLLLLVVAVVAALAWFVLGGEPGGVPEAAPVPASTAADAPVRTGTKAHAPTEPRAGRAGRAGQWVRRGAGTVAGQLREYGTDRPLAGVTVVLAAGAPGPDQTLTATSRDDGTFAFGDVAEFPTWTLHVTAPAPLADTDVAPVAVVTGAEVNVGVVYLSPAFAVPGIVVDERGAPVEGANVAALRWQAGGARPDILRMICEIPQPPAAVDSAVSGKDGTFAFRRLAPGTYDVGTRHPEYAHAIESGVVVTPASSGRTIRLVARRGHDLVGRVVRKGEGTVAGLQVVALREPSGGRFIDPLAKVFTLTDDVGAFRLPGLAAGEWILVVTPDGEPFTMKNSVTVPTTSPIEIVLEGDATVEGTISGPDGKPILAAHITIVSNSAKTVVATLSDAAGRYSVRGVPSGRTAAFLVVAEGYAPFPEDRGAAFRADKQDLTLNPGANVKDVVLGAGGVVRGTVVEQGTGTPVAGARVQVAGSAWELGGGMGATTDAAGRFEVRGLRKGPSGVHASKEGWYPVDEPAAGGEPFEVRYGETSPKADPGAGHLVVIADAGAAVERRFELARAAPIRGTVVLPDGSPAAGAQVTVVPEGDRELFPVISDVREPRLTDTGGNFELAGLAPNASARIVAKSPGYVEGRSEPIQGSEGDAPQSVSIRLRAAVTVVGRVTDAAGQPVEGAIVRANRSGNSEAASSSTDATGAYRIEGLAPGDIFVHADHPRFALWTSGGTQASDGQEVRVDAVLDAGAVVTGTVVDPDGRPVVGARVSLAQKPKPGVPAGRDLSAGLLTDAEGVFRGEGLARTTHTATAQADGFLSSDRQDCEPGAGPVTLRLQRAFRIAGVVQARGGAGIGGLRVTARKPGAGGQPSGGPPRPPSPVSSSSFRSGLSRSTTTTAVGSFELTDLPDGVYEVSVASVGRGAGRPNVLPASVAGVAAGRTDLTIDLDPGMVLRGRVFGADGKPAASGTVKASRQRAKGTAATPADSGTCDISEGSFDIPGLAAGAYEVVVQVPGHAQRSVVAESGGADVRVDMTSGGSVRGRVLLPDGSAAAGITVRASGSGGGSGETDDAGRFEILHVAEGEYTVQASQFSREGSFRASVQGVSVRDGAPTDVGDLKLEKADRAVKIPAPPVK